MLHFLILRSQASFAFFVSIEIVCLFGPFNAHSFKFFDVQPASIFLIVGSLLLPVRSNMSRLRNRSVIHRSGNKQSFFISAFLAISFFGFSQNSIAEANDVSEPTNDRESALQATGHHLTGHQFMPSFYFPSPFALPNFSFGFAFGEGRFIANLPGGDRDLKVGGFLPKIEGQIKISDRLVLTLGGSAGVTFGTSGDSVGVYGASAGYIPSFGLLWNPIRTDYSVLGLAVELEKPYTIQASPIEAATREIGRLLGRSDRPLADEREVVRWRPSVRYAHGLSRMFGYSLFGSLSMNSENLNDVSTENTAYALGGSLDIHLQPQLKIPAGVTVNYRYSDNLKGSIQGVNSFTVGLFEAFSKSYNVGLEIGRLSSGDRSANVGAIVTRYYY
jgi:hypothetical protein